MKTCENCQFYMTTQGNYGQCHRHPPAVRETRTGKFPLVHKDDWCGDGYSKVKPSWFSRVSDLFSLSN